MQGRAEAVGGEGGACTRVMGTATGGRSGACTLTYNCHFFNSKVKSEVFPRIRTHATPCKPRGTADFSVFGGSPLHLLRNHGPAEHRETINMMCL